MWPDVAYDAPLWTNRQHMAGALAAGGDRVLYVEPFALYRPTDRRARHPAPPGGAAGSVRSVSPNLWVLRSQSPVPYRVLRRWPGPTMRVLGRRVRSATERLGLADVVHWSYSPMTAAASLSGTVVYDIVDDYPTQRNYARPWFAAAHLEMTRGAQVVLTTTDSLRDLAVEAGAARAYVLGNAADVKLFGTVRDISPPRPAWLPDGDFVVFWGAVTEDKLDFGWLAELDRQAVSFSIVLVGPMSPAARQATRGLSRVTWHDRLDPTDLLPVIAHSLCCLIPYRTTEYTRSVSALKIHEAHAAGKPVIASAYAPAAPGFHPCETAAAAVAAAHELQAGRGSSVPPLAEIPSWEAKAERARQVVGAVVARGVPDPSDGRRSVS